jgi:DNA-binding TFAR19-related protein (PDSD5 family)
MREQLLGRVLSKEAYARLGNVQSVDPGRARLVEDRILNMARTGRLLQEVKRRIA